MKTKFMWHCYDRHMHGILIALGLVERKIKHFTLGAKFFHKLRYIWEVKF